MDSGAKRRHKTAGCEVGRSIPCSVREIAVQGTHKGEWCGIAGTGRRVKFHACALYLFSKDDTSGKLLAERLYFDNETVMKQINGQAEAASVPEVGDHQIALAK